MSSKAKTVGIVGTGVIGGSWTALFLAHGWKAIVSDPAPGAEKALAEHLERMWPTMKEIGLDSGASLSNYKFVGASLDGHYDQIDFIQESGPERPDIKTKIIADLDAHLAPDVVIASSSSGITSSHFISGCTVNPARVLIGHPFNPPHMMPLVEVVPHPACSEQAIKAALSVYSSVGKRPVLVKKEVPGFAANRLQAALCNEAYSLVANGILSAVDVDACVTTSLGPRWALIGPYMTSVFAGGGGKGGFTHYAEHLGPAVPVWLKDMHARQVEYNDELWGTLGASVDKLLEVYDPDVVERQKDELLVRLLREKKGASALV